MSNILGVTAAIQRDLFAMVKTTFNESFDKTVGEYQTYKTISTIVPSNTKTNNYPFFAPIGDMEEWVDERQMEALAAIQTTLTNRSFEKTLEVTRDEIEDEQLGMAMARVSDLGQAGARKPEIEVAALLNKHMTDATTAGKYEAGFDSSALFSETHVWPVGYSTSQDNLRGAGTAHQGKMDLTYGEANLEGAYTQMAGFKNSKERLIGGVPDTLMCSASTWFAARKFLESVGMNVAITGSTDVTAYERPAKAILPGLGIKIVVNHLLTTGYWLVADTKHAMKPVVFQNRQPIRVSAQDTAASDDVFNRKVFKYGIDSRFAVAPGYWFYVVGGDAT